MVRSFHRWCVYRVYFIDGAVISSMVRLPSVLYRRCGDFIDGALISSMVHSFHRRCASFVNGALTSSMVRSFYR
eukprot:9478062-Pyramimonas_sp.AAC.1